MVMDEIGTCIIGRDFLAKRSVSVCYKSVSYMRDPTLLLKQSRTLQQSF